MRDTAQLHFGVCLYLTKRTLFTFGGSLADAAAMPEAEEKDERVLPGVDTGCWSVIIQGSSMLGEALKTCY